MICVCQAFFEIFFKKISAFKKSTYYSHFLWVQFYYMQYREVICRAKKTKFGTKSLNLVIIIEKSFRLWYNVITKSNTERLVLL